MVLHAAAREHFHALLVAALKARDCCRREHVLLTRVVNLTSASYNSTDVHKGVLAAGVLLGNAFISGFPISASIAALVISDDEVEELITSSDDGSLSGRLDGQHMVGKETVCHPIVSQLTRILANLVDIFLMEKTLWVHYSLISCLKQHALNT